MSSDKFNNLKEEAYIGQEMLDNSPLSDTEHKCIAIRQTVRDGDFSLEEALLAYDVPQSVYNSFIEKEARQKD